MLEVVAASWMRRFCCSRALSLSAVGRTAMDFSFRCIGLTSLHRIKAKTDMCRHGTPGPTCRAKPSRMIVRVHVVHLSFSVSIKKSQGESHGQNLAISLRFGQNRRLEFVVKLIPNAPNGQNILRCIRVRLNFLPEFSDKCHDVAVIHQIIMFPYGLIDLFLGEHLAPVAS